MAKFKNIGLKIALRYIRSLTDAGIRIKKAYLYGSYAREAATKDSDIDIAIVSPDFTGDRFNDAILLKKFRINVDYRIEPLPLKPEDFIDSDPIVSEILSYAIPISVHTGRRSYKAQDDP